MAKKSEMKFMLLGIFFIFIASAYWIVDGNFFDGGTASLKEWIAIVLYGVGGALLITYWVTKE